MPHAPSPRQVGKADSRSTYGYNGTVYANGGLNGGGAAANRGFEACAIGVTSRGTRWEYSNPQTQAAWQAP